MKTWVISKANEAVCLLRPSASVGELLCVKTQSTFSFPVLRFFACAMDKTRRSLLIFDFIILTCLPS